MASRTPSTAGTSARRTWWIAAGVAVAVAVAAVFGAVVVILGDQHNAAENAVPASTVTLEPIGTAGPDPFLAAVRITEVTEFPGAVTDVAATVSAALVLDPATGTRGARGDTETLYGGSGELAHCDVAALADYLAANPAKAAAWAGVRGVAPGEIRDYLTGLTPVVLMHDTLVTNHGFSGDVATPRPAVLQAGTAVLVDDTGLPVVRCACGNPIAAPPPIPLASAALLGTRWAGYDPARVTTIGSGASQAGFVLVDVLTGERLTWPAGAHQRPAAAAPSTTAAPAPATSGPDCAFQAAWGGAQAAWVESRKGSMTCADMIAKWRQYEDWPGARMGQAQAVLFEDGSDCGMSYYPPSDWGREHDDGSIGSCQVGEATFVVWRGQLGQHITLDGVDVAAGRPAATAQPAPEAAPAPAPAAGECVDGPFQFSNGGWGVEDQVDMTCREMVDQWNAFLNDRSAYGPGARWNCYVPSAGDYGGCVNQGDRQEFMVDSATGQLGGGGDEGDPDDLGVSRSMSTPACDGTGIVILGSATEPGSYQARVQELLDQYPDASYLRTDRTGCASLNHATAQGNPIYAVYRAVGRDQQAVCAAIPPGSGAYGKWLDNSSSPSGRIPC